MTKLPVPAPSAAPATAPVTTPTTDLKPPRRTKAARLRARLNEPGGASLTALMEMTGWQAHSLRAALTGLRKAGLTIIRHRSLSAIARAITGARRSGPRFFGLVAAAGHDGRAKRKSSRRRERAA